MIQTATVEDVTPLGTEIKSFRLRCPGAFDAAAPGAHVDLSLPNGLKRQYSMWNWDPGKEWVAIGVKNETAGRGGSKWLHDNLTAGASIEIGAVRNNFALDESANGHTLIAGGIGVTPMVPMARRLRELNKPFTFYYLARDAEAAGFAETLDGLELGDKLVHHRDDRDGTFDLDRVLGACGSEGQVYFCGPEGLLKAVLDKTAGWPAGRVRFERFVADADALSSPTSGFDVELRDSGLTFHVPEDQSILDVLLDNGLSPDFACMDGVCASCITPVLEGEVDHRDSALSPEEHDADHTMCICVSRAKGTKLVLDL